MDQELLRRISELADERSTVERHLQQLLLRASATGVPQRELAEALRVSQPAVSQAITHARARALDRGPRGREILKRRKEIVGTAGRHDARAVRVFGSVARGEDTVDSDVDLLVRMPGAGMLAVSSLAEDLEDLLAMPVDVVAEHFVRPEMLTALERDAIAL